MPSATTLSQATHRQIPRFQDHHPNSTRQRRQARKAQAQPQTPYRPQPISQPTRPNTTNQPSSPYPRPNDRIPRRHQRPILQPQQLRKHRRPIQTHQQQQITSPSHRATRANLPRFQRNHPNLQQQIHTTTQKHIRRHKSKEDHQTNPKIAHNPRQAQKQHHTRQHRRQGNTSPKRPSHKCKRHTRAHTSNQHHRMYNRKYQARPMHIIRPKSTKRTANPTRLPKNYNPTFTRPLTTTSHRQRPASQTRYRLQFRPNLTDNLRHMTPPRIIRSSQPLSR